MLWKHGMIAYPFKRILVPTDFSTCSDAALELAARLAADHGAELVVLHVVDHSGLPAKAVIHPDTHPEGISVFAYTEEVAQRELAGRLARLPVDVPRRRARVAHGAPAATILAFSAELAPDLIVMGSHGRSGLAHLLAGSVAEKVMRACIVPLLAVRESSCREQPLDLGLDSEAEG